MKYLMNENAKQPYLYCRENMPNLTDFSYFKIYDCEDVETIGRGKYSKSYTKIYCGFDIETYTTETHNAFMYIWQFSIWDGIKKPLVIHGRTWEEFDELLVKLQTGLKLSTKRRLLVWVANIGYEWAFIRKILNVTDYFFKDERTPLKFSHNDCIDFQECLSISGGNLKYLAKTYTNTQKCIGDLDYNIPRNSKTELSIEELGYCDNDVLILSEWSKYYFDEYMSGKLGYKSMPLTMQSTIRHDIKELAKEWYEKQGMNPKHVNRAIASCYPSEPVYHFLMTWCFRGGYTHGNLAYIGHNFELKDNIASYDFTSSYPSVMEQCYFPERLYHMENVNKEKYLELIKTKCVIATITFYDVKAKTQHSIESKSKCIELVDPIIDNGRVRNCKKMTVCITELDYRIYARFYEWTKMKIVDVLVSNRIKLPNYVLEPMEKDYTQKALLKAQCLNYAVPKSRVNSYYGVMVTRLNTENFVIDNESETGLHGERGDDYETQISRSCLLPQWGIYITNWSRKRILDLCAKCGEDCLYIDTDSIKVKNSFKYEYLFKQYNTRIEKMNRKICEKRNLDFNIFHDLGCLDLEVPKLINLKYLGAKRYLYSYFNHGKISTMQTIAGLPKGTLEKMFPDRHQMYDEFKNEMLVEDSGKLYSYYNDNETSEYITDTQGNTVLMTELSNVGLAPCNFKMSLDGTWLNYFLAYQETLKGKEVR